MKSKFLFIFVFLLTLCSCVNTLSFVSEYSNSYFNFAIKENEVVHINDNSALNKQKNLAAYNLIYKNRYDVIYEVEK